MTSKTTKNRLGAFGLIADQLSRLDDEETQHISLEEDAITMTAYDRAEILRGLKTYHKPDDVFEIRVPKAGRYKTISGYFDRFNAAADVVVGLDDGEYAGVYFTINPVKPALLSRSANRTKKYAETTTSDNGIIRLNWLPIDLDAKRPAGISSTDAEHSAAIEMGMRIKTSLVQEQGWPAGAFILADSGNGCHLCARIDLPNTIESTKESEKLIGQCLEALNLLFSDNTVEVDTTSGNPSRIWKLPGTVARKGDNTADRPHRLAHIIEAPNSYEVVPREKLVALSAMAPKNEDKPKTSSNIKAKGFDPVAFCQEHEIRVHHTKPFEGGTAAILERCIFNPDHRMSAVVIG